MTPVPSSGTMKTPEKAEPSDICTTTENSPLKELVTSTIKLPPGVQFSFEPSEGSSLVRLTHYPSKALLDELTTLNKEMAFRFSMFGDSIFFDDLGDAGETPVHEAAATFLNAALLKHGGHLGALLGEGADLIVSMGNALVGGVGVPDVSVKSSRRGPLHARQPNLLVEVAYSVSLADTHAKIDAYFDAMPGLMAAVVVDIEYPWRTLPPHGLLDFADGKMAFYYYERPSAGSPLRASYAVSFGHSPLTAEDVLRARNMTGVHQAHFRGHGVRAIDPPCDAANIELYRISIPAAHLLADDPQDAFAGEVMAQLLQAVQNNINALQFSLDLFRLKNNVLLHGVYETNLDIATALGIELPHQPLL